MKFNFLINNTISLKETDLIFDSINKNIVSPELKTISLNFSFSDFESFQKIQDLIPNKLSKIKFDLFLNDNYVNVVDFETKTDTDIQCSSSIFDENKYNINFVIFN